MLWEELREEEFDAAIKETGGLCVVPVGCFEMHGQHLPVVTDVIQAEAVVKMASKIEPVCVFPAFRFGDVSSLVDWKGAVRLEPELMLKLLENLCSEISRNGFKKILLYNYHGGNAALLGYFERSMMYRKKDYVLLTRILDVDAVNPKKLWERIQNEGSGIFPELLPEDEQALKAYVEEKRPDGHGGMDETSCLLALRPELVAMDRIHAVSGYSNHKAEKLLEMDIYPGTLWNMEHPNSYEGDPIGASARIGQVLLRLRAERQAEACRRFKEAADVKAWYEEHNQYYPD